MTDTEYIAAFRVNDQRAITLFYDKHREDFLRAIGGYYRILNPDLLAEIFQEAVLRLWKNITSGKLSESNLSSSLAGYLYSVGKLVALEIFRREGINVKKTVDEEEMSRLMADAFADTWLGRESEQEVSVRRAVYDMGDPCAPLLLMFYWDSLTLDAIADKLKYKDANSAKSQKYKCIQKLKARFL